VSSYLVVDDDIFKRTSIVDELKRLEISGNFIVEAISVKSAMKALRVTKFNIVVLDLNLPTFDNGSPIANGGLQVLEKLKGNPEKYLIPENIIGLTAYADLKQSQFKQFSSLDFSIFNFEEADWIDALSNKVRWQAGIKIQKEDVRIVRQKVIISVHGIRTKGEWQQKLEELVENELENTILINYKYNYLSATSLLFSWSRDKTVDGFNSRILFELNKFPEARVTFIAHSFGTYIVGMFLKLLPINTDFTVERVIFVNSVLKENFDWNEIRKTTAIGSIINECGIEDNVLLLSRYLCKGLGMAGRSGFIGVNVHNRRYKGGHDFFYKREDFFKTQWVPLFEDRIDKIDEREFGKLRENHEVMVSNPIALLTITMTLCGLIGTGAYFYFW
jgi:CheY-like chemotaxis protein